MCECFCDTLIPEAANLTSPRERIRDSIGFAALQHATGHRYSNVTIIVSPQEMTLGGFAIQSSAVVGDGQYVDTPRNAWVHEYVHTRQPIRAYGPQMEWYAEGAAMYFAARLSYEQGIIPPPAYNFYQQKWTRNAPSNATLANSSSWHSQVEYVRGTLVLAALDAKIRSTTNGNQTLEDVDRRLNQYARNRSCYDCITYPVFKDVVANVSGTRMDPWLDRYILNDKTPEPSMIESNPYYHPLLWEIFTLAQRDTKIAVAVSLVSAVFLAEFVDHTWEYLLKRRRKTTT